MNLGENIFNAFEVVNKTHENVSKLMDFCRTITAEKREFDLMSPKFLRDKSDVDYNGWNISQMYLLFQDTQDELLENGWRNGPIYVLDICLYSSKLVFDSNVPTLTMAKFEYDDINSFSPGVSPASTSCFFEPLYDVNYDELEEGIFVAKMQEEMTRKYWGVKRVVYKESLLVDVNYENAYDVIFGSFKDLKNK